VQITSNELLALTQVLQYMSVKDLLTSAMNDLSNKEQTRAKDNANLLFYAIHTYLVK